MKSKLLLFSTILILSLLLSSCATIWDVQNLQNQIDTVKSSITSIASRVVSNNNKISDLQTSETQDYNYLNNTINSIIVNYPSMSSLNERIKKLEDELNSKINQNDKHYENLKYQYDQVSNKLSLNELQIKNALDSIADIQNTQDTFSKALSTFDKSINTLQSQGSQLETISSKVNVLSDEVLNIEKSINEFGETNVATGTIKTSDFIILTAKVNSIKDRLDTLDSMQEKINQLQEKENILEENIARMQTSSNSLNITYTYIIVQKGDTLYKIAKAYNTSIKNIESLNNKSDGNIYSDEMIKLPIKDKFVFPFKDNIKLITPYGSFVDHSLASWVEFNYSGKVVSILPGRINEIGNNIVFGKYVRLYCGNYIYITYGNLQSVNVSEGDWIGENQTIGYAKNFKLSISINGDIKDPLKVLSLKKDIGTVTYYTEWDDGKNPTYPSFRITRMGTLAKDWQTIAADLSKMPLGTIVYIPYFSKMPNKGIFRVEDSGSAVNGNDIDIFISDIQKALKFKKNLEVYVIKKPS